MGGSRKVRKGFAVLQGVLDPYRAEAGQREGRAMEGTSQDSYTLGGWCGPGCRGKKKPSHGPMGHLSLLLLRT